VDGALDQALGFELAKPLGEQPVGDPRHRCQELAEEERPVDELEEDRAGPAAADQLDCGVEARADRLGLRAPLHIRLSRG
jgi:hypothetical protein